MRHARLPRRTTLHVLGLVLLASTSASAVQYRSYENRELVHEAEAVIEGTITAIVPAPGVEGEGQPGLSVATVKVKTVYKGTPVAGEEIRIVYWSRRGASDDGWHTPDKYRIGEELTLPLRKKEAKQFRSFDAPPEAAKADWALLVSRYPYDEQVQSPGFRAVAAVWGDPNKHLVGERRHDAIYFLAVQGRLQDDILLPLLASKDLDERLSGCRAAQFTKSRIAFGPLTEVVEACAASESQWRENPDLSVRAKMMALLSSALRALQETPFDPKTDAPLLLRLASTGQLYDYDPMVLRILNAGPARREIVAGLLQEMDRTPRPGPLKVLLALDARAAYAPLRKLASQKLEYRETGETFRLVQEYQTAWAKRFALDLATERYRGSPSDAFSCVRSVFHFTQKPVDPYELRENAGQDPDTWTTLYAELRKACEEQFPVFEKDGPSFAELPKWLAQLEIAKVHRLDDGASATLDKSAHSEMTRLLVDHSDPRAKDLNFRAPAKWLVDLYAPRMRHLPSAQLWVAADGTFGFGWLPDRAWGKSAELASLLGKAVP